MADAATMKWTTTPGHSQHVSWHRRFIPQLNQETVPTCQFSFLLANRGIILSELVPPPTCVVYKRTERKVTFLRVVQCSKEGYSSPMVKEVALFHPTPRKKAPRELLKSLEMSACILCVVIALCCVKMGLKVQTLGCTLRFFFSVDFTEFLKLAWFCVYLLKRGNRFLNKVCGTYFYSTEGQLAHSQILLMMAQGIPEVWG